MNDENIQYLYTDLDCLLDTRLGLLRTTFPKQAKRIEKDQRYYKRVDNKFPWIAGFPWRDYEDTWNARTYEHVKGSPATKFAKRFKQFCMDARIERSSHHGDPQVVVNLNIFPYRIPNEELELMRARLQSYLLVDEVRICNLDYAMVPLSMLPDESQFAIYDIDRWVNAQIENLQQDPRPKVGVVSPFIQKVPMKEKPLKEVIFTLENSMKMMFELTLLPLADFSA